MMNLIKNYIQDSTGEVVNLHVANPANLNSNKQVVVLEMAEPGDFVGQLRENTLSYEGYVKLIVATPVTRDVEALFNTFTKCLTEMPEALNNTFPINLISVNTFKTEGLDIKGRIVISTIITVTYEVAI